MENTLIKLRLDADETELLDGLVDAMKQATSLNLTRTSVAAACFREGWLIMHENYARATPAKFQQNRKTPPKEGV